MTRRHLKTMKWESVNICKCGELFQSGHLCYKHRKTYASINERNFLCNNQDCEFRTKLTNNFAEYLKNVHNIVIEEEIKEFQNYLGAHSKSI